MDGSTPGRCQRCIDPTLYFHLDRLADDEQRHSMLLRCPDCGSLYDLWPEVKGPAEPLTVEEAARRYPGTF